MSLVPELIVCEYAIHYESWYRKDSGIKTTCQRMTGIKLYNLYENLLHAIEERLTDEHLTADQLSGVLSVSSVHLQRLFKSAFDTTLASYIRSRRLAASLEKLVNSDLSITTWTSMQA